MWYWDDDSLDSDDCENSVAVDVKSGNNVIQYVFILSIK